MYFISRSKRFNLTKMILNPMALAEAHHLVLQHMMPIVTDDAKEEEN